MRGVGERPGVAADVDVQRDVPVHPEQRDDQGARGDLRRQGGPHRQPRGARGGLGGAAQNVRAPGAVRPAEREQRGRDHARGRGGERHLEDRGTAGGLRLGGEGGLGHDQEKKCRVQVRQYP